MCQGRLRPRLIEKVRNHLIQFGQHPKFLVWKGPNPKDDYDEEWATKTSNPNTKSKGVQVDEGVHMENTIDNLFQLEPMANGLA
jgi:hypothetical protein